MGGTSDVERAAQLIREGKLVAFPTETVYGLGANALNPEAVARIYKVKGRPATSPLIVHVESIEMARSLVRSWPDKAQMLAERFWPGPLTLVIEKQPVVPDNVTSGLPTVGVRMPAHPMAIELLRTAQVPIAAPSANPFTQLSPTSAAHVLAGLGDGVDMVLDGGPATVGIESTVLSLAGNRAVLLRPGAVSRSQIEEVIGPVETLAQPGTAHMSPGLHPRHYSPSTRLVLVSDGSLPPGRGAYVWFRQPAPAAGGVKMPSEPSRYAAVLYDTLHRLDAEGWDWIAVETPPEGEAWHAVRDRLTRAAAAPASASSPETK
jgi:Sua5/YciO/YrdC/YwlC family protein